MILTKMKLHSAITGGISTLVEISISNIGTGTPERGNYFYHIKGRNGRLMKTGHIYNWPRKSRSPLALLQRVINDAYPKGAK